MSQPVGEQQPMTFVSPDSDDDVAIIHDTQETPLWRLRRCKLTTPCCHHMWQLPIDAQRLAHRSRLGVDAKATYEAFEANRVRPHGPCGAVPYSVLINFTPNSTATIKGCGPSNPLEALNDTPTTKITSSTSSLSAARWLLSAGTMSMPAWTSRPARNSRRSVTHLPVPLLLLLLDCIGCCGSAPTPFAHSRPPHHQSKTTGLLSITDFNGR